MPDPNITIEDDIRALYSAGDWSTLLSKHSINKFLPWIWPSLDDLLFISQSAKRMGCTKIVSIGCGSGLMEWLLNQATGVPVKGVEVDRSWWYSKYSSTFLNLEFVEDFDHGFPVAGQEDALLFCYFNNQPAFLDYLEKYNGTCLIVIGPGPDRGTHTDPTPFKLPPPADLQWRIDQLREVSSGKDFIGIFKRTLK